MFPLLGTTAQAVSKWFAWACLMPPEPARALLDNLAAFGTPPPLSAWAAALTLPQAESAIDPRDGSSDVDLLSRATLLTLGVAGYGEGMSEWGIGEEVRRARRREVEAVANAVERIEERIRELLSRVRFEMAQG